MMEPPHAVELRLFGAPLLRAGNSDVALPRKRTRALLYYLAADPARHPRALLADLIWPELDERRARRQLSDALTDIRRALGADAVGADADHTWWALAPVDAPLFSTLLASAMRASGAQQAALLQDALSLFGGEFMQGFDLDDAENFEHWLHDLRTRCTLQALEACNRLAKLRLDAGDSGGAITAARRGIAIDALHEELHRILIEALWLSGDRAAALRQHAVLRDALERELGIAPAAETQALHERISAGSGTPAARASSRIASGARALPTALRPAGAQPPLAGRQRELGQLLHLWQQAQQGQAALALITGEPGIGKSRLAMEFGSRVAADGALVLAARCPDVSEPAPLAPIEEALRPAAISLEAGKLAAAGPEWAAWIGRLIPEVGVSVPPPPSLPIDEERHRLEEAVVIALRVIANGNPLLLIIEDLHSAHPATVALLHRLARRDLGVMVLTTSRDTEPSMPGWLEASRMIDDLAHEGRGDRIDLSPLSIDQTVEMMRSLISADGRATRAQLEPLARLAEGHPLFAAELARAVIDSPDARELPQTLSAVIRRRLDGMPPHERHVLDLAAAVGEPAPASLLARAAGRDPAEEAFVSAIEDGIARRLLREEPHRRGHLAIAHNLIATAAYALLSAPRRRALHSRIAAALADDRELPLASRLDARARHHRLAGEFTQAAHQYVAAGERAASLLEMGAAAQRFAAAVDLFEGQGMLPEAASACERACQARQIEWDPDALRTLYAKAVELHASLGSDRLTLARLHRQAAEYMTRFGYCGAEVQASARAHVEAALRLTEGTRSPDRCRALAASSFAHGSSGQREEALRDALESVAMAEPESAEWLQAMDAYQCALSGLGRKAEALEAAQRRLPVAQRLDDDWELCDAGSMLAAALLDCNDPVTAEEHARMAERVATRAHVDRLARTAGSIRCDALIRCGRGDEAEPLLRAMLADPASAQDSMSQRPYRQLLLAQILEGRGDHREALELANSAGADPRFDAAHFADMYPWCADLIDLMNRARTPNAQPASTAASRRSGS